MSIFLHSDDINLLDYWKSVLGRKCEVIYDLDEVEEIEGDVFVVNYTALQPNVKENVEKIKQTKCAILVLDRVPKLEKALKLLEYGIGGYGNALMQEHFINSAVKTIKDGLVWLHPGITSELIQKLPENATENKNNDEVLQKLTNREKEVALMLRDGKTYRDIAEELDITPRTIKAHAQHIYHKLDVKDRLELAMLLR